MVLRFRCRKGRVREFMAATQGGQPYLTLLEGVLEVRNLFLRVGACELYLLVLFVQSRGSPTVLLLS